MQFTAGNSTGKKVSEYFLKGKNESLIFITYLSFTVR